MRAGLLVTPKTSSDSAADETSTDAQTADPPPPPEAAGLHVAFASATVLLAMKLLSNRERDFDDLVVLTRTLGLTEPHELVAIVHEVYPDGWGPRMPDDEELTIDAAEVLREVRSRRRKDG